MSKYAKNPPMCDDSARAGADAIAHPKGQEGNMDHAQGSGSRSSAMSGAVDTLNKQVARGKFAPVVGGRKMADY